MKILLVDPHADWSTRDVYVGLRDGLREHGHEVIEFRSGRMMMIFVAALEHEYKRQRKLGIEVKRPSPADAGYLVSERAVTWGLRHEPDWTIVVSGMYYHPDALVLAKRAGLRTAVLLTETPYDSNREAVIAPIADLVWTNERTAVAPFRSIGANAYYLPHAWNPDVHRHDTPIPPDIPAHDVLFVGTGFMERVRLLGGVDWPKLGVEPTLCGSWPLVSRGNHLRRYVSGSIIANADAAYLYRRAAINLNLFRTSMGFGRKAPQVLGAESLGPRAYELAALGAFFLSERRAELTEVFGDLVPTFASAGELEDLVRRWLPDVSGRTAIAAALPAAVRNHSWIERAGQVVSDLRRTGGPGIDPARDAPLAAAPREPLGTGRLEVV